MALAWWLVPCLPFPGLPHIYFLFTVRLTNERVGVFLARRSVQHLVILCSVSSFKYYFVFVCLFLLWKSKVSRVWIATLVFSAFYFYIILNSVIIQVKLTLYVSINFGIPYEQLLLKDLLLWGLGFKCLAPLSTIFQ